MLHLRSFFLAAFVCFFTAASSQDTVFSRLPSATQSTMKQIAAKYKSGPVNQATVETDLKKSGIDFSKMSIEDAVMLLFNLMANDARKDMKELVEEMDATRRRRAAIREAELRMKEQTDSLRNANRRMYEKLGNDSLVLVKKISAVDLHIKSVDEAIKNLKRRLP